MVRDEPFSHKKEYVTIVLGDSRRASKLQYWFKSYGDFEKLVDFSYWWSFSGEGSVSAACAAGCFCIIKTSVLSVCFHRLPCFSNVETQV